MAALGDLERTHQPPCGVDDPRIRTFGLLLEAHAELTRQLDADMHDSDGISLQTFEVLLRISRSDRGLVTMSQLASAVSLTTGGVTRLADRLTAEGLVQRMSCPDDRRVVHLALTDVGVATLTGALEHHLECLELRVASRIGPDELPAFEAVLDRLRRPDD